MPVARVVWPVSLVGCALLGGCWGLFVGRDPLPTVPGPESPDIASITRLCLVESRAQGEIVLRRLSDGGCTVLLQGRDVWDITGPDRQGRVAYLDGDARSDCLWLHGGESRSPRQLLPCRPSESSFLMGRIALSPVGGRIAFWRSRTDEQDPSVKVQDLAVMDLATGAVKSAWSGDCQQIAWFPDGKRIAFEDYDVPAEPRVRILDLDTGNILLTSESESVRKLVVDPEGTHVYVVDWSGGIVRIDVASGERAPWSMRGLVCPIAFSEDGKVVGFALPTEGAKQEYVLNPMHGPIPKYAIKLFDLASGASCTVAPPGAFGALGGSEFFSAGEIGE